MSGLDCTYNLEKEKEKITTTNWKPPNGWLKTNFLRLITFARIQHYRKI